MPSGIHKFGTQGDPIFLENYGLSTTAADNSAAITAWINDCVAQGKPGTCLTPGTYMVVGVNISGITSALEIDVVQGVIFKGTSGTDAPVIELTGDSLSNRPPFTLRGLTIDNSLRTFVSSDDSGTALQIKWFSNFLIENCSFISTDDYRDGMGDSGISPNQCAKGLINHCYFRGQPDVGIYITGGPSSGMTDDEGDIVVQNCFFDTCSEAGDTKRAYRRVIFTNNTVYQCRTGFHNAEASGLEPGYDMIVASNYFKRCESRVCLAKPGTVLFVNNVIEDWGFDPDGTNSSFNFAVLWETSNGVCNNNVFLFRDWNGTSAKEAIRVQTVVVNSVSYPPSGNLFYNNTIADCLYGIRESTGATGNFGYNLFDTVTNPILKTAGSTSKYDTVAPSGTRMFDAFNVQLYNIPKSTAPASPVDGDVWIDSSTSTGWKIRVNGSTRTVLLG